MQFAFPASELRKWKRQPTEDKKVTWIDPPSPGHSIIVSILFSGQELPDDKWPGAANGTHLVDSKLLPNGEKLWLLWQDCPTSMHEQTLLSETREIMRQREPVRFSTITDDSPPGPRTLVFKEFKQDGFLLVLDAATDSFASTPSYQDLGKKIETTVNGEGLHMTEVTKIRWGWLRFMYGYTILGAGGFGLAILTMPDKMRGAVRWPGDEPIALSIVGSVYLAFGVLSVFGLREPLKFVPVLLLQLCYKLAWFIGAVVPLLLSGRFPSYAVVTAVIFATYVVGDLIAIPFSYVLSSHGRPHSDA
ncbi:MAG: hypothetical protein JW741_12535 [Sedimentisphaerales bacterium]|nr:hypothetical protein [Sedimentisphaerales bacterium]